MMDITQLGAAPIPGGEPAGSDIRSEEKFEKLSAEIDKMSSPSAAGAIDWEKVLSLSADILANDSKDLLVACYLSIALIRRNGLKGFASAVHVWRDMVTTYWETLFPARKRMRGRINAIDWWVQKTSAALRELTPEQWKQEDIDGLYGDLDTLDTFFRDNVDEAPAIGPLMSILGSVLTPVEERTAASAAQPAAPAEPSKQASATPAAPRPAPAAQPVPSGDDPEPLIKHALDTLRAASDLLMQKDPPDALYFRINRTISWMAVTSAPPGHSGRTMLEPPDADIRELLKNMRQANNWKDLLAACESRIPQYLFWLDLSRYICEALGQLGHAAAAKEIEGLTKVYVERLSGIEKLTFADGMPFADQATRQWLSDIGRTASAGSPSSEDGDAVMARIDADMSSAGSLAGSGNIAGAIGQLRDALAHAPSARERFIRQVRLCRFLRESNQNKLSWPYFRELVAIIDTYHLSDWEPALAAEAYDIILAGLALADGTEDLKDLRRDIFRRLSLLDPVKAMEYA